MSTERKRVEISEVPKAEPRKRVETLEPVKAEPRKREQPIVIDEEVEVNEKPIPSKVVIAKVILEDEEPIAEKKRARAKASDDKYIRFSLKEYSQNFKLISDRVQKDEIRWAYYAIDGDEGYHYFIINK
jgi:hypothetical protein